MNAVSPLRYPGGKQLLGGILQRLISDNDLEGGIYAEPYAGGAGAALKLLFSEHVNRLILNDADPCIYAMWISLLHSTEDFCRLIRNTPISIDEWKKQKQIYSVPESHSALEVGFATFYLNRTNRSGIIKSGGPIGGYDQSGPWKIDARFNRLELIRRVEKVSLFRSRISFFAMDAIDFLNHIQLLPRLFVYLDPPYFVKGSKLYLNHYFQNDHKRLATFMKTQKGYKWVMSYDKTDKIQSLYKNFRQVAFTLSYSATERRNGKEILILSKGFRFPREWRRRIPAVLFKA